MKLSVPLFASTDFSPIAPGGPLYTRHRKAFQGVTRTIGLGYPGDNCAYHTLAITSARMMSWLQSNRPGGDDVTDDQLGVLDNNTIDNKL